MDYNGNSIRENPFLKSDGAGKRLMRRRPIVIRENDPKKAEFGFKMKRNSDIDANYSESPTQADLEYGPGIVEKLRAKFSKLSGAQKDESEKAPNKKYSSCDDLLSDNGDQNLKNHNNSLYAPKELTRRTSRSISDMIGTDEIAEKPITPTHLEFEQQQPEIEQNEAKSITQLRRRFEKNGEQLVKMRFARDPVQLVSKFHPELAEQWKPVTPEIKPNYVNHSFGFNQYTKPPIYKPPTEPSTPINSHIQPKTANVLKVLNDAPSKPSEPEFVQIARRLRRFQPDVHENAQTQKYTPPSPPSPQQPTPNRPAALAKWQRRQPEMPVLSDNAKIIRESCDISAILPTDPHTARISKQPIPQMSTYTENGRSNQSPLESSPPPEEPKPTTSTLDSFSQYRKTVVDISGDRNTVVNSVFKYENTPQKTTFDSSIWKTSPAPPTPTELPKSPISPFSTRRIDDISSKSVINSPGLPSIVSISVKTPVTSNRIYSNYDKSDDNSDRSPIKPPTTYAPSYISTSQNSVSLSSKYIEEKAKTSQTHPITPSNSLSGLLSPREKPYGDDVTILKSDNTNATHKQPEQTVPIAQPDQDESDDNSSSDDDSRDSTGSYDVTPMRPNSLVFTRLANEDEVGGDGNKITRSLLSLVAEEDLPDFLVALNEKPVRFTVIEETERQSTSSILRVREAKKEPKTPKGTRIRFCTESPMAYAYLDEITATKSLSWDDGTIIEYSYFKELEEQEEALAMQNDPTFALIEQWEKQIANETNSVQSDPSFVDTLCKSTSAY